MKKTILSLLISLVAFTSFAQLPPAPFTYGVESPFYDNYSHTQAEIDAMVIPAGKTRLAWNVTTGELQWYNGTDWICVSCDGVTTLQEAIEADDTATSEPKFEGGIKVGNNTSGFIKFDDAFNFIHWDDGEYNFISTKGFIFQNVPPLSGSYVKDLKDFIGFIDDWDANTNMPTLNNSLGGRRGYTYRVSVAGSHDFGAGSIDFEVDDYVINDGTIWRKFINNNQSAGGGEDLDATLALGNTTSRDIRILGDNGSFYQLTDVANSISNIDYTDKKVYARDGFSLTIQPPALTTNSTINYRDGDVDFTGGSDGDVFTIQSDGSVAFETPSGGGTDDQTASEVAATPYLTITGTNVEDQLKQIKDELDALPTGGSSDIVSVVDVTAMRAFASAPLNGSVFYLKEHTQDKIGGGYFYWDDASTDTDDNFETIKATTITNGRFKRIINDNTASIEQAGAIAGDTTDDTQAFLDARDYLISKGGGTLIIPNRGNNRFYISNGVTNGLADYSNITITGGGKIFIDELVFGSGNSRGVFVKLADGTDNFKMYDLDILVDANAVTDVTYYHGVICSEQVDDCTITNVFIEKVKIHSEVRLDSELGNHGITFTRNSPTNQGTLDNITIRDCDIKLYGNSIYGIHLQMNGKYANIEDNHVFLEASTSAPNEAYNAIACYADREYTYISGNHAKGGHSTYAVSTSGKATIIGNWAYNCTVIGEAGFEIEYKGGHGTVGYQPEDVIVSGNNSIGNYIGYLITDRINDATSKSPRNIILTNNIAKGSTLSDAAVTSSFGAGGNNTTRISNVILDGNIFLSECSYANVELRDASNTKIINNILEGGNDAIHLGRNSAIKVRGTIDIDNNTMRNYTDSAIRIEAADDVHLSIDDNKMYGGVRGVFINTNLNAGGESSLSLINNLVDGTSSECYYVKNSGIDGIIMSLNKAFNTTNNGFEATLDNGIFTFNVQRNTGSYNINGTGIINENNQDF